MKKESGQRDRWLTPAIPALERLGRRSLAYPDVRTRGRWGWGGGGRGEQRRHWVTGQQSQRETDTVGESRRRAVRTVRTSKSEESEAETEDSGS